MTFLVTCLQTKSGNVWRIAMGRNLIIVGGGAGGPSTAAEAKRRDPNLKITIIERGEFVSYAS
jgi:L-2-hydroxyglutarate oxidase LhgO